MNIIDIMNENRKMQDKLPKYSWNTWRTLFGNPGKPSVAGDLISFGNDTDYVTIEEARGAVEELAALLDGKVKWRKGSKDGK